MVNVNEMTDETMKALAFSEDEKAVLDRARKMPVVFDEDCPETTPERALRFKTSKSAKRQCREEGVRSAAGELCLLRYCLYFEKDQLRYGEVAMKC